MSKTLSSRLPSPLSRRALAALVVAAGLCVPGLVFASHRFSDVPNTNTYHADIDALADAGVTTGCGDGTTFCPSAFVTREQMAAFMNRLGALGAGKTPVVNADRLDGIDSTGFVKGPIQAWREIGAAGQPGFTPFCASVCTNMWANYGNGYNTAAFYKDPLGIVRLKGLVQNIGFPTNPQCHEFKFFTLPAGYRPAAVTIASTMRNDGFARIDVLPSGEVALCTPNVLNSGDWYLLDGITFRAAQ